MIQKNYKWIVFISFLALIFLPKMMPLALLKWAVIIVTGGLCVLFEYISLHDAKNRSEVKQTWFLMLLTLIMVVVNFVI